MTLAQGTIVSVAIMHLGRAYKAMTGDYASVIPTGNFWDMKPVLLSIDTGPVRMRRQIERLLKEEEKAKA